MSLRVGMGDSYGLRITVPASADLDPSAVTGVVFHVTKPSGERVKWTGTLDTQSASSVRAVYTFSGSGLDLDQPGDWTAWLRFTQPGKSPGPTTDPFIFPVLPPAQV